MSTTFAAASSASDFAGEWHLHHGGNCPVDGDTLVKVQFRDDLNTAYAESFGARRAESYPWTHTGGRADIVAFRIVERAHMSLSEAIVADASPWLRGMASPFMQRFIFGALILAAATFVAMLVVVNS